jgi:uncharacterized protein
MSDVQWPGVGAETPNPPATPARGLTYDSLHRAGKRGIWRPIVGVITLGAATYAVIPLLTQLVLAIWFGFTDQPIAASLERVLNIDEPTPFGLAVVNVILASGIVTTWLVTRWLHGIKPGWVSSVQHGLRWRYLAVCLLLSLVALVSALIVSTIIAVVAGPATSAEAEAGLNEFTKTTRNYLLVILVLTPLQAAGEEYLFRGYLTQAFGGLFGPWVAVLIPAVLFALAHGIGQSLPVFVDRLAFGIIAGVLVLRTGGLEAAIAMHVLNNWVAFGFTLAFGDMAATLTAPEGRWWDLAPTVVQSLLYLGLALMVARTMKLRVRTDPRVLAA